MDVYSRCRSSTTPCHTHTIEQSAPDVAGASPSSSHGISNNSRKPKAAPKPGTTGRANLSTQQPGAQAGRTDLHHLEIPFTSTIHKREIRGPDNQLIIPDLHIDVSTSCYIDKSGDFQLGKKKVLKARYSYTLSDSSASTAGLSGPVLTEAVSGERLGPDLTIRLFAVVDKNFDWEQKLGYCLNREMGEVVPHLRTEPGNHHDTGETNSITSQPLLFEKATPGNKRSNDRHFSFLVLGLYEWDSPTHNELVAYRISPRFNVRGRTRIALKDKLHYWNLYSAADSRRLNKKDPPVKVTMDHAHWDPENCDLAH